MNNFKVFFSSNQLEEILKKSIAYDETQVVIFTDEYLIKISIEGNELNIFIENFEKKSFNKINKEEFLNILQTIKKSNSTIKIKIDN